MSSSLYWSVCLALPLFASAAVAATDEQKIIRLEQDVRKLERIVQDQARQIDDLRRQLGRPTMPDVQSGPPSSDASSKWLSLRNWQRIRPGASERDVLDLLGPPTQMRTDDDGSRVLLYAMEIGTSGFLGGNVTVKDRKVVDVQEPTLR